MATTAELQARITEIEERLAAFAGVRATAFADQSTTFDVEGAQKELARLRTELAIAQSSTGTRARFATFDKGV